MRFFYFFYFFYFLLSICCDSSEDFKYLDIYSPIDLVYNIEGSIPNDYFSESFRLKSFVERINLSLYVSVLSGYFLYCLDKASDISFTRFLSLFFPEFDFLVSLYKKDSFKFFRDLLVQLNVSLYKVFKPFSLRYWDLGLKFSCYIWRILFVFNYSVKRSFYFGVGSNLFKNKICKAVIVARVGKVCDAIYELAKLDKIKGPFCLYNIYENRDLTDEELNEKIYNMFIILDCMGFDTDHYNITDNFCIFLPKKDKLKLQVKNFQLKLIFSSNEECIFNRMLSYFNISKEELNRFSVEENIYIFVKERTDEVILKTKDKELLELLRKIQEYFLNDRFFYRKENVENLSVENAEVLLKSLLDILKININEFNQLSVRDKEKIIISKYKALALSYHPDKGGCDEDFKKISEAKDLLLSGYF